MVEYDTLQGTGRGGDKGGPKEEWDRWELTHKTIQRNGARIEAINEGNNRFRVTTLNVTRFSLWLSGEMVDFDADIQVSVDGKERFAGRVNPSLPTLLGSFERRGDWGMVYPGRVQIDLEE